MNILFKKTKRNISLKNPTNQEEYYLSKLHENQYKYLLHHHVF